jgi:hypothetical protein
MFARRFLVAFLCVSIVSTPTYSHAGDWGNFFKSVRKRSSAIYDTTREKTTVAYRATKNATGKAYVASKTAIVEAYDATKNATGKAYVASKTAIVAAYDVTTRTTIKYWNAAESEGTVVCQDASSFFTQKWDATTGISKEAWQSTAEWCEEHKDELVAVGCVVVVAIGTYIFVAVLSPGNPDMASVGPGQPFTQAQKREILSENRSRNGGQLKSDVSGILLYAPKQHVKGVTPPWNEAHVDHVKPRAKGGANSFRNAQILSRQENLSKGAR